MSLLGYARTSRVDQVLDRQVDALSAAGCWRVWRERASGARDDRPVLAEVLAELRPGDVLMVTSLDRLGRSLQHLLATIERITGAGAELNSLAETIDTRTTQGRLMLHMCGALAEFERALLRERTMEGLAAARARGRVGGRPRALTVEQVETARQLVADGTALAAVARVLGASRATVRRALPGSGGPFPRPESA